MIPKVCLNSKVFFFFFIFFMILFFLFVSFLIIFFHFFIIIGFTYSSKDLQLLQLFFHQNPILSSIVTLKIEKKNKLFCFVSLTELIYTNILLKVLEDSLYSLLKADPASITTLYMSNLFSKSKPSLELILIVKNFLS